MPNKNKQPSQNNTKNQKNPTTTNNQRKQINSRDLNWPQKGLDVIMRQYSEGAFEYSKEAVKKIVVVKVEIESMTGKQSA